MVVVRMFSRGGLLSSPTFQRRFPPPVGAPALSLWCVRVSRAASSALVAKFIVASDTSDQMAGQVACVGAGFIMMTETASLMQSGSGTQIEFVLPPPNKAAAANPAIASELQGGRHWRGVAEPER